MSLCSKAVTWGILFLLVCICTERSSAQTFDPYRRLSDPRAICRLDGPDTLPVRISDGVGWPANRDPVDGNYIISSSQGSGVITHIWLMMHEKVFDSLTTVKLWVDDSMLVISYLYEFFKEVRGILRPPFDSVASGGLNCDVQIPFKRNFKLTFYADYSKMCCLFWGVEYRPILDSTILPSFRLNMGEPYQSQQSHAADAYDYSGSPWNDGATQWGRLSKQSVAPGQSLDVINLSGPGMIRSVHLLVDTSQFLLLRNVRLRMFWDHCPYPSVDVPLVDFFGCGSGFRNVNALQCKATESGELTSYFPSPYAVGARIQLVNISSNPIDISADVGYSNELVDRWNQGYFLTQYYESNPARWHIYHRVGTMLGRGKFIGIQIAIPENPPPYFLEGDPYIYIDSTDEDLIHYTGLEDYLTGGWFFSDSIFSLPFAGCTRLYSSEYRFHYFDAYDFHKSFLFQLEHGVRNDFQTTYHTTAFFFRRWTPFWVSSDTIRSGSMWSVGGSGYKPNEQVKAAIDSQIIFSITADAMGEFKWQGSISLNVQAGLHNLTINGYTRPETIVILAQPNICFLDDSTPHVYRYNDSLQIFISGFNQGENVSVSINDITAKYLNGSSIVDSNGEALFSIRVPWLPDGSYVVSAKGNGGNVAISDDSIIVTRALDYEVEDLIPIVSEAQTEKSYFGYYQEDDWSNQYTRLFYPDQTPGRRLILPFIVPISDIFHVVLYNTLGSRYGDYYIFLDSEKVFLFHGFRDTSWWLPFRSAPLDCGIHYLKKGTHYITFTSNGKDPKALDYLLNTDNFILTPTTAFHPLPKDTDSSVPSPTSTMSTGQFVTIYPNPLTSDKLNLHLELDSLFVLGTDRIVIEIFDILGRRAASVLDGTINARSLDLVQDCSGLSNGKYYLRAQTVSARGNTTKTISLVVDR
ncbi:MAG TPA: DUF2961 domain-containing protein [Candidatus Kapabacteria bacterium]|nr:DUF2961 domain-containing protein [Candidatus Kapabacteria bacterium]